MELVDESDDEGGHVSGVDTDREDWVGQVQCVARSLCLLSALVELGSPACVRTCVINKWICVVCL
jgi:hypothetical protein